MRSHVQYVTTQNLSRPPPLRWLLIPGTTYRVSKQDVATSTAAPVNISDPVRTDKRVRTLKVNNREKRKKLYEGNGERRSGGEGKR
jgi:hypothetical protein